MTVLSSQTYRLTQIFIFIFKFDIMRYLVTIFRGICCNRCCPDDTGVWFKNAFFVIFLFFISKFKLSLFLTYVTKFGLAAALKMFNWSCLWYIWGWSFLGIKWCEPLINNLEGHCTKVYFTFYTLEEDS